jgi:hypothetical protein
VSSDVAPLAVYGDFESYHETLLLAQVTERKSDAAAVQRAALT